ncbi:MAG: hypothetical protein AB7O43_07065 [Hyphomicrobiaceae bacterium]
MSPSKTQSKSKAAGPKPKARTVAKRSAVETVRVIPAPAPAAGPNVRLTPAEQQLSTEAMALARAMEASLAEGERGAVLDPAAVQGLLSAVCKVYSRHIDLGEDYDAFSTKNPVTPTDVMVTASGLLKAANLAVFELGMWQSWTGR